MSLWRRWKRLAYRLLNWVLIAWVGRVPGVAAGVLGVAGVLAAVLALALPLALARSCWSNSTRSATLS